MQTPACLFQVSDVCLPKCTFQTHSYFWSTNSIFSSFLFPQNPISHFQNIVIGLTERNIEQCKLPEFTSIDPDPLGAVLVVNKAP